MPAPSVARDGAERAAARRAPRRHRRSRCGSPARPLPSVDARDRRDPRVASAPASRCGVCRPAVSGAERAAAGPSRALDPVFAPALACFFLSGFAALLYQTVWTRQFAFVFGTADLAVATVLAAYMGGLAVGAALAARVAATVRAAAPRLRRARARDRGGGAARAVRDPAPRPRSRSLLFGSGDAPPSATGPTLAVFYLGCAFVILLVPTVVHGSDAAAAGARVGAERRRARPRASARSTRSTRRGRWRGPSSPPSCCCRWLGLTRTVLVGVAVNAIVCVLRGPAGAASAAVDARARASPAPALAAHVAGSAAAPALGHDVLHATRWCGRGSSGTCSAARPTPSRPCSRPSSRASRSARPCAARLATTPARAARGFALAAARASPVGSLAAFRGHGSRCRRSRSDSAPAAIPTSSATSCSPPLVMLPSTLAIGATFPFAVRVLAHGRRGRGARERARLRLEHRRRHRRRARVRVLPDAAARVRRPRHAPRSA